MDMKRKNWIELFKKLIRYLSNILLSISLLYFLVSWVVIGNFVFTQPLFWSVLIALWQVVIMLILVEQFYLLKK